MSCATASAPTTCPISGPNSAPHAPCHKRRQAHVHPAPVAPRDRRRQARALGAGQPQDKEATHISASAERSHRAQSTFFSLTDQPLMIAQVACRHMRGPMHGALSAADLLCGLACILTLCPRQPLEIVTLQACLWAAFGERPSRHSLDEYNSCHVSWRSGCASREVIGTALDAALCT